MDYKKKLIKDDIIERVSQIMDSLEELKDLLESESENCYNEICDLYDAEMNEEAEDEEDFKIDLDTLFDYCENAIDEMDNILTYMEDFL